MPAMKQALRRYLSDTAYVLAPIVLCAIIWQLVVDFAGFPTALLPPLGNIFDALVKMFTEGTLVQDVGATFRRLIYSALLGAMLGTFVGILMGFFHIWEKMLAAPLNFMLAVPGTALFPLTMMWFGLTEAAILSILVYEVALTVATNTWTGVKSIDLSLIRAGRAFGARGFSMLWRVLLPAALPSIITGYRLGLSRAWRILIVAEMLVSVSAGLGYRLFWARELFQTDVVYAGLFVVGTVGLLVERVLLRTVETCTIQRWGTVREL